MKSQKFILFFMLCVSQQMIMSNKYDFEKRRSKSLIAQCVLASFMSVVMSLVPKGDDSTVYSMQDCDRWNQNYWQRNSIGFSESKKRNWSRNYWDRNAVYLLNNKKIKRKRNKRKYIKK